MRLTTASHGGFATSRPMPPAAAGALAAGALLLVFALDRATGSAPVQHLYYLPIILAAARFGMSGGVAAGVSAIALYHVANPQLLTFRYGEADLVQVALFLAVGTITAKLTQDASRLRRLAMTDDLTGLHNLRSFEARLELMVRASGESRAPLALLVLDLDRLKELNDRYGHLTGAEAVRAVGHLIAQRLPPDAVACRYGGDEFVIAVPQCPLSQIQRVADDLRRAVHDCTPVLSGQSFAAGTLSISVGVASASFLRGTALRVVPCRNVETGESLFRAADAALYRAKAGGRNQVCVA
jgi:diguanylate cyclase (GGDEF)-like protein